MLQDDQGRGGTSFPEMVVKFEHPNGVESLSCWSHPAGGATAAGKYSGERLPERLRLQPRTSCHPTSLPTACHMFLRNEARIKDGKASNYKASL